MRNKGANEDQFSELMKSKGGIYRDSYWKVEMCGDNYKDPRPG